ncbi:hypothetical protein HAALTHF_01320n [Vreelandella aquamarina]|nr:hypothetical protein HAALTHF_01320n [Halomonas axialensis]
MDYNLLLLSLKLLPQETLLSSRFSLAFFHPRQALGNIVELLEAHRILRHWVLLMAPVPEE